VDGALLLFVVADEPGVVDGFVGEGATG